MGSDRYDISAEFADFGGTKSVKEFTLTSDLSCDMPVEDTYSYPAAPLTLINIPDPKKTTASFTYNFYMPDERAAGVGEQFSFDLKKPTERFLLEAALERQPRYVAVEITPADFSSEDDMLESLKDTIKIEDYVGQIMYEDAISNAYFSSVKLKDTQADDDFYLILSSSVSSFGNLDKLTGVEAAEKLAAAIEESNMAAGSLIRETMGNMQSQGVSYAEGDIDLETAAESLRNIKLLEFDFNVNNLIFGTMVKASLDDQISVYEDELRGIQATASTVQDVAVASIMPGVISADDYEMGLKPILQQVIPASYVGEDGEMSTTHQSATVPVGFIIEKAEIREDGGEIKYEPMYADGHSNLAFIDTGVRYGGVYVYRARTVALVRFEAICRDPEGVEEDQLVIAVCLMASGGRLISAYCTETIPPPPPSDLKFMYDYEFDNLIVLWQPPFNTQQDQVRYQILRRTSINVPFTIIAEIDFDQSVSKVTPPEVVPDSILLQTKLPQTAYRDEEFTKDSNFIYTVACVDARGYTSNYSIQMQVSFDIYKNKLETSLISRSGAPKPYPNLYLNVDTFADSMKDSGHSRMKIYFNPEYYRVIKETYETVTTPGTPVVPPSTVEVKRTENLNVIGEKYKLHIINTDWQQDWLIDIKITDETGPPVSVDASSAEVVTLVLE